MGKTSVLGLQGKKNSRCGLLDSQAFSSPTGVAKCIILGVCNAFLKIR